MLFRSGLFSADESVLAGRTGVPTLAQTSAPFRGLQELLDAFPRIQDAIPELRLRVYSGQATYQVAEKDDPFADLYSRCRTQPGVDYVGPIPQPSLARALREAWILAYPCVFSETSCIAVMEAMAAGCEVVTVPRAALPETTAGFARMTPLTYQDRFVPAFADGVIAAIRERRADPVGAELRLRAQVRRVMAVDTWRDRAEEWEDALVDLVAWKRRVA